MPSAISRPSEPVDTVSMSIDCMFLPSRMIEPLPKLRSIWESAASRAFDLSMDDPSTRRSAALIIRCSLWPGFDRLTTDAPDGPRCAPHCEDGSNVHYLFSVRNMFFSGSRVLSYFRALCPSLIFGRAFLFGRLSWRPLDVPATASVLTNPVAAL